LNGEIVNLRPLEHTIDLVSPAASNRRQIDGLAHQPAF